MHKFGIEMISSLSLTRCCKNLMTLFRPPKKFFWVRRAVCQNTTRLVNPLVAQFCNAHCKNRALKNFQFTNFCHLRHCPRSLSVFDLRPASIFLSIGSDWIALSTSHHQYRMTLTLIIQNYSLVSNIWVSED